MFELVDERKTGRDVPTERRRRCLGSPFCLPPACQRGFRAGPIVLTAKERDLFRTETVFDKEIAEVVLRLQRFGENYHFPRSLPRPLAFANKRKRFQQTIGLALARKRSRVLNKALDSAQFTA